MDKIIELYSKNISHVSDPDYFVKNVIVPAFNKNPNMYPKELRYELEKHNLIKKQSLKEIMKNLRRESTDQEIKQKHKEKLSKELQIVVTKKVEEL